MAPRSPPARPLRNLDLNLMVVFEAIYTSGNISAAAERLALSQPTVSNGLARLRVIMGDPLFERSKGGVEATPKARKMIGPIRDALKLIGAQIYPGDPDLSTYKRHFRVIIADPIEAVAMPATVNAVRIKMPLVTIEGLSVYSSNFVSDLVEGVVDLACYIFPISTPDIVTEPITALDPVIVARRGHPAFRKKITAEAYLKLDHVMLAPDLRNSVHVEQSMAARGAVRHPMYTVSRLWSSPALIEGSDLVGLMPRWFANKIRNNFAIEIHDLPVQVAEQHIYMTWHARDTDDAGHRWLRETIMSAFRAATAESVIVKPPSRRKQAAA